MGKAKRRKRSRDATPDEIFHPEDKHHPIPMNLHDKMNAVADGLNDIFPGCIVTLFVSEIEASEGRALPTFNYISTGDRADMLAVLEAFIAKNRAEGATVDKIADEPPTATKQ